MSNVKKQAKVASKNNPSARGSKIKYFIKDKDSKEKEIVVVKFYDFTKGKSYMGARYVENKQVIVDINGDPIRWNLLLKIKK